ncbi:MAG: hypothetical protein SO401_00380 [Blautia sp.]|nr:hypothetical protein [Blautia sp.]
MILTAIVSASGILGAQYWGKGEKRTVNDIFCISLRYAGVVSLLFFAGWGIAIPLAAAGTFLFHLPVLVLYACTCPDEVGKIPWVMVHYKKYIWVKDLTRNINGIDENQ